MIGSELEREFYLSAERVRAIVKNNFLPFIARGIANLVDHGAGHVEEVLKKIEELCIACSETGLRLSPPERYLLELTAWLHDLGCLISRENHELESCKLLESIKRDLILDDEVVRLIKLLIKFHRKRARLDSLCRRPPDYLFQQPVRLDLLVALFRLADACDMGSRSTHAMVGERAPPVLFKAIRSKLPRRSRKHWLVHMACLGTSINPETGRIAIHRRDRRAISLLVDELNEEISRVRRILEKYHLPFTKAEIIDHVNERSS